MMRYRRSACVELLLVETREEEGEEPRGELSENGEPDEDGVVEEENDVLG